MGLLAGSITLSGGTVRVLHGVNCSLNVMVSPTRRSGDGLCNVRFGAGRLDWRSVARYLVKHSTTPNGIPDDQKFRLRSKSRMWAA